ncbi:MAG TPA: lysylphosphatidylglycerol synthase transmembrane domain-containing protein [Candidatus Binataceae bacterium]|nr:lysylphosphatidylglycerol synthase transmembrane domain-containing protein [Candidatus Binataceae bacterium]
MSKSAAPEPAALADGAPSPARRSAMTTFAIRGLLGLGLLALLLKLYGFAPIVHSLAREQPRYFLLALAIYVGGQVMSAYRWMLLARILALRARWRDHLRWYFIGMFTNLFVPGLVGGDAARAVYLGFHEERFADAVASVAADRGIGLIALIWFAAAAGALITTAALPTIAVHTCALIAIASFAGYVAAPLCGRLAARLPGKLGKLFAPVIRYLLRPLALVPALALSVLLQVSLAYAQYLIALGIGLNAPLSAFMVIVPMANVVAALPLTLNGLGLREGAYLVLLAAAGVAHQDAIALGLLWFSCTMLGGLAGLIPFLLTPLPWPAPKRVVAPPTSAAVVSLDGSTLGQ